jgi:hypothetical protein
MRSSTITITGILLPLLAFALLPAGAVAAQPVSLALCAVVPQGELSAGFAGQYEIRSGDAKITLTLQESAEGNIVGDLVGATGILYRLEGTLQEGAAVGTCYTDEGTAYFEARLEGDLLRLDLIELGEDEQPDYGKMTSLELQRVGRAQVPFEEQGAPAPLEKRSAPPGGGKTSKPSKERIAPTNGDEIGEPSWGFAFRPPDGWVERHDRNGVIMGHNTIGGMILVYPHREKSLEALRESMANRIEEEKMSFTLKGALDVSGSNRLRGTYTGTYEDQPAQALGVATLSPYGGGAVIIAITSPDQDARDLFAAADAVAAAMSYSEVQRSAADEFLAKTYYSYSGSSTSTSLSSTERWLNLCTDGTFSWKKESSTSVNRDAGTYGDDGELRGSTLYQGKGEGTWTAEGDESSGTLILTYHNGEVVRMRYEVSTNPHDCGGYGCAVKFDGRLYHPGRPCE